MTQYNRFIPGGIPIDSTEQGRSNWLVRMQRGMRSQADFPKVTQTASFTAGLQFFYPVDCTGGAITVTLPAANTVYSKHYVIKKVDSSGNAITISPTGSDTIDGQASATISAQWGSIYLACDGVSNWYQVAGGVGSGGSTVAQAKSFTTTGAFSVTTPVGCTLIRLRMIGGGGNTPNATTGPLAVSGAGNGEFVDIFLPVASNTSYSGVVGANAIASSLTIGAVTYTAAAGANGILNGAGGAGGGRGGAAGGAAGTPGVTGAAGVNDTQGDESGRGGNSGGGCANAAGTGGPGVGSGNFSGGSGGIGSGATGRGGGASSASFYGPGVNGAATTNTVANNGVSPAATSYGVGASGPSANGTTAGTGANGAQGFVEVIFY